MFKMQTTLTGETYGEKTYVVRFATYAIYNILLALSILSAKGGSFGKIFHWRNR